MADEQKYIAYRRVSKAEKETGSTSLEAQSRNISQFLAARGATVALDFFDDGISGSIHLSKRPQGGKLMALTGVEGATVIVDRLDRAFRSVEDMAATLATFRERGLTLISARDSFDVSTGSGRLVLHILTAIAEFERSLIRERIKASNDYRKAIGQQIASKAPYGFVYEQGGQIEGTEMPYRHLVKNEEEQKVIKDIMMWRFAGFTLREIAEKLNKAGVPSRQGKPWRHSSIQGIVNDYSERMDRKALPHSKTI